MSFIDPPPAPEAGEGSGIRAKDLKNKVVVLRRTGEGRDDTIRDKNDRAWVWTEADVWVIDRAGIELHESGLRVSWWRVQEQLKQAGDSFVAGKIVEQEDRSVILAPVAGAAREVLEKVMPEIIATPDSAQNQPEDDGFGDEPI